MRAYKSNNDSIFQSLYQIEHNTFHVTAVIMEYPKCLQGCRAAAEQSRKRSFGDRQVCISVSVWPETSYLSSLSLCFFIYNFGSLILTWRLPEICETPSTVPGRKWGLSKWELLWGLLLFSTISSVLGTQQLINTCWVDSWMNRWTPVFTVTANTCLRTQSGSPVHSSSLF